MLAINCSQYPDDLLETKLFGYVKGAYTGADPKGRAGLFETADGGTVFLDEVHGISEPMQIRLLRALEYGFSRVGTEKIYRPNTRIITGSHRDLAEYVRTEKIRLDFYARIMGATIALPPLRQREGDVEYLANLFCYRLSKWKLSINPDAMRILKEYHWPANVRELISVIGLAVDARDKPIAEAVLGPSDFDGLLKFKDLGKGDDMQGNEDRGIVRDRGLVSLEQVAIGHIRYVLGRVKGNKSAAATILGISRQTLKDKLRRWPERQT